MAEVLGDGLLPHKEEYSNNENCLKMEWAALGRLVPPEEDGGSTPGLLQIDLHKEEG